MRDRIPEQFEENFDDIIQNSFRFGIFAFFGGLK